MLSHAFVFIAASIICGGFCQECDVASLLQVRASNTDPCTALASGFDSFVEGGIGGGVIRVQKKGKKAFARASGNIEHGQASGPMLTSTLFEIASITKTFVSALILYALSEGKIDSLEAKAAHILHNTLPQNLLKVGVADGTPDITIGQLLNHTSGLSHFWSSGPTEPVSQWFDELGWNIVDHSEYWAMLSAVSINRWQAEALAHSFFDSGAISREKIWKPMEVLEIAAHLESATVGKMMYSDTGYVILGLVVEKLFGADLSSVIANAMMLVLGDPHHISNTFMRYNVTGIPCDQAVNRMTHLSHRYFFSHELEGAYDTTNSQNSTLLINQVIPSRFNSADWASGGLVTNAEVLGRFWMEFVNSDHEVPRMMKNSVTTPGTYGYGLRRWQELPLIGHDGDGGAVMWYDTENNIVITGTNNDQARSMNDWVSQNIALLRSCAEAQPDVLGNS